MTKILAALIVLQLGIAGIGVVTADGDDAAERLATDPADSFGEIEDAGDAGVPSESSPPPVTDPSTGAAPVGEAAPPVFASGEISAPREGTYRYTQTSKSTTEYPSTTISSEEETQEVERRIERISETPGEIVDRRHTPNRQTSSSSDGSRSESRSYEERVWRPEGSFLRTEVSHSVEFAPDGTRSEDQSQCDWEPDRQQLAFPLRVGLEWSWKSNCSRSDDNGSSTTTSEGTARVVGTRELDIGGRSVPTFIIDATAVEDTQATQRNPNGSDSRIDIHSDQRATTFFAPSLGLTARIEAENKTRFTFHNNAPGYRENKTTQTSTSELLSVDPT